MCCKLILCVWVVLCKCSLSVCYMNMSECVCVLQCVLMCAWVCVPCVCVRVCSAWVCVINMHIGILYVMYVRAYIRVRVSSFVFVAWHSDPDQFSEAWSSYRRFGLVFDMDPTQWRFKNRLIEWSRDPYRFVQWRLDGDSDPKSCHFMWVFTFALLLITVIFCLISHVQILVVHVNYDSWPCSLRWYLYQSNNV